MMMWFFILLNILLPKFNKVTECGVDVKIPIESFNSHPSDAKPLVSATLPRLPVL